MGDWTDTPTAAPAASVPATLALTLGTPAAFGAFTPGVAKDYTASTTANVISTAGDATLSVADPSRRRPATWSTARSRCRRRCRPRPPARPVSVGALADVGGSAAPTSLLTYSGPTSATTP